MQKIVFLFFSNPHFLATSDITGTTSAGASRLEPIHATLIHSQPLAPVCQ